MARKKSAAGAAEARPPPPPHVFICSEKDLLIGAKKSAVVPLVVPSFDECDVDLVLHWQISVRHATLGFSGTFIPDIGHDGSGGNDYDDLNVMMNHESDDEVSDAIASAAGDEAEDRSAVIKRGGPRRLMRNLLRRGNSAREKRLGEQEEEIASPLNGVSLPTTSRMVSIKDHDRVCRGETMRGSYRLGSQAGKVSPHSRHRFEVLLIYANQLLLSLDPSGLLAS
jgi:hypothetical protein